MTSLETVTGTFARPCLSCGATVRSIDSVEQPHDCRPPSSAAELVARAWWNGHDLAAAEVERLRSEIVGVLAGAELARKECEQLRAHVADLRGRLFSIYAATAAALTSAAPSGEPHQSPTGANR